MASTTNQSHQQEMARLVFEANQTLHRQAQEHADATARHKQEAVLHAESMANYMSAKQAAESKEAHIAFNNELQQRDLRKEAEVNQLQLSLKAAELSLVQKEAERVQQLAAAYQRRIPSGSHEGS